MGWYDRKVRRVRDLSCGDTRIFLEVEVRRVDCRNCGKVKREQLDFLADNPLYTKRFAYFPWSYQRVGLRSGFSSGCAVGSGHCAWNVSCLLKRLGAFSALTIPRASSDSAFGGHTGRSHSKDSLICPSRAVVSYRGQNTTARTCESFSQGPGPAGPAGKGECWWCSVPRPFAQAPRGRDNPEEAPGRVLTHRLPRLESAWVKKLRNDELLVTSFAGTSIFGPLPPRADYTCASHARASPASPSARRLLDHLGGTRVWQDRAPWRS
jgi:hypothetical protein